MDGDDLWDPTALSSTVSEWRSQREGESVSSDLYPQRQPSLGLLYYKTKQNKNTWTWERDLYEGLLVREEFGVWLCPTPTPMGPYSTDSIGRKIREGWGENN